MYFGRHIIYREALQEMFGHHQEYKPDIDFYMWFYEQINPPCQCMEKHLPLKIQKLRHLYHRDLILLQTNKIKIIGALASLCEARGMNSTDAWCHYYFIRRYHDLHGQLDLARVEPQTRRFSLRIAKIQPAIFGTMGCHNPLLAGCMMCNHLPIGCTHCFDHNRLSYDKAAHKLLGFKLDYHSKCRGKGCSVCYQKKRKQVRRYHIRHGNYQPDKNHYHEWYQHRTANY